jgi:ubiquitin carboxyl-terminal hydrolase 36/42
MELDLTPYMSSTDGSDLYDLYAVVVHLDMLNASFFGHYICYIKGYRGMWYKIDDCKVYFHLCVIITTQNRQVTVKLKLSPACLHMQVMTVDVEEVHAQGAYMLLYSR